MDAIVADPVGNNIYFITDNGIEVMNTDGSGRKTLLHNNAGYEMPSLAVDLKKG